MSKDKKQSNDDRANSKDSNNQANKAVMDNRSVQLNTGQQVPEEKKK